MTELEKAITSLTSALISESPHKREIVAEATARGVLVILQKLQEQVSS